MRPLNLAPMRIDGIENIDEMKRIVDNLGDISVDVERRKNDF